MPPAALTPDATGDVVANDDEDEDLDEDEDDISDDETEPDEDAAAERKADRAATAAKLAAGAKVSTRALAFFPHLLKREMGWNIESVWTVAFQSLGGARFEELGQSHPEERPTRDEEVGLNTLMPYQWLETETEKAGISLTCFP